MKNVIKYNFLLTLIGLAGIGNIYAKETADKKVTVKVTNRSTKKTWILSKNIDTKEYKLAPGKKVDLDASVDLNLDFDYNTSQIYFMITDILSNRHFEIIMLIEKNVKYDFINFNTIAWEGGGFLKRGKMQKVGGTQFLSGVDFKKVKKYVIELILRDTLRESSINLLFQ